LEDSKIIKGKGKQQMRIKGKPKIMKIERIKKKNLYIKVK